MTDNFSELLARKKELVERNKELVELTRELDEYCIGLLERKRELLDRVDEVTAETIKPMKDEMSEIGLELDKIMRETGQDKIVSDNYGAYMKAELSIKITDMSKALAWLIKNPKVMKADIIKTAEVNKLLKDGIVPDPDIDGVDCNDSYQKVTFRKK